jgi:hypothetical protein
MYRQSKQDNIDKDIKKLVLGKTRYHNGTWGIFGYQITAKKSKKKVREPLVKFSHSKGERGSTNIHVDYPDSWNNVFKGKKSSKKRAVRYKTTVRDVTNQKLLR